MEKYAPDYHLPKLERKALVHGHCHHKSVMKMKSEENLLNAIGLDSGLPDTGCCGMAGSFGFEATKYDISKAVGERVLLPAVRAASKDTLIVADGFSCREQIEQLTDRHALHSAQVLKMARESGPQGPSGNFPERNYLEDQPTALKPLWHQTGRPQLDECAKTAFHALACGNHLAPALAVAGGCERISTQRT